MSFKLSCVKYIKQWSGVQVRMRSTEFIQTLEKQGKKGFAIQYSNWKRKREKEKEQTLVYDMES